jgi:branched-chain amino acid transport system ATP-binding protein
MTARLECTGLVGGRGSLVAFRGVDLSLGAGTVLTVLGPNGAGKSTLLLTLAGILPAVEGSVSVDGSVLRNGRPARANKAGLVLVPDNRCLFGSLSVEDNLRAAMSRGGRAPREILDVFPGLASRWAVRASSLSGGEQQMLAMARAMIQDPKVLLVDEMSMGLAPQVVESLFHAVRRMADEQGCTVVLVEQYVSLALAAADHAVVLSHGSIALQGPAGDLLHRLADVERAYLGEVVSARP